jgi:hypothetical protein
MPDFFLIEVSSGVIFLGQREYSVIVVRRNGSWLIQRFEGRGKIVFIKCSLCRMSYSVTFFKDICLQKGHICSPRISSTWTHLLSFEIQTWAASYWQYNGGWRQAVFGDCTLLSSRKRCSASIYFTLKIFLILASSRNYTRCYIKLTILTLLLAFTLTTFLTNSTRSKMAIVFQIR